MPIILPGSARIAAFLAFPVTHLAEKKKKRTAKTGSWAGPGQWRASTEPCCPQPLVDLGRLAPNRIVELPTWVGPDQIMFHHNDNKHRQCGTLHRRSYADRAADKMMGMRSLSFTLGVTVAFPPKQASPTSGNGRHRPDTLIGLGGPPIAANCCPSEVAGMAGATQSHVTKA